ncbi:hypothetical protein Pst134EB_002083 [Puccinia striiformis f. sp. tritici]|nr:hypothetical protein Pst134EB_002083 [Puccinia striiformis f. sp. tritici]
MKTEEVRPPRTTGQQHGDGVSGRFVGSNRSMARQATGDGPVGRIVVARQRERALQIFEHASDLLGGFAWQTLCRASSLASAELGGTHNGSPSQFLPAPATRCGRLALQWGRPALHGSGREIGTPSRINNSYAVQWLLSPFRFRLGRFRDPASPQKLKFQGV